MTSGAMSITLLPFLIGISLSETQFGTRESSGQIEQVSNGTPATHWNPIDYRYYNLTQTKEKNYGTTDSKFDFPLLKPKGDFEIILNKDYFVDKTLLLEALFDRVHVGQTIIITMPRGFGKTTNMHMVKAFAEIEVDYDTGAPISKNLNHITNTRNYQIFTSKYQSRGLKIAQNHSFMKKHFGKYPVIHLDFKDCGPIVNRLDIYHKWQEVLKKAFKSHSYLLHSRRLTYCDKIEFRSWLTKPQGRVVVCGGLWTLMESLCKHFNQRIVVLIDEYDSMITSASNFAESNEELNLIVDFHTAVFSGAFKDRRHVLKFALLNGITNFGNVGFSTLFVSKLPERKSYLFARNEKFQEFYGFTAEEIKYLFDGQKFNINSSTAALAQKFYNGYEANGVQIYNPVSIVGFLQNKKIGYYWSEIGSIKYLWPALRSFLLQVKILDLMNNKTVNIKNLETGHLENLYTLITCIRISNDTRKQIFGRYELNIFLNFLLDLGYLKINSKNETHLNVMIPNEEIRLQIKEFVQMYYSETEFHKETLLQKQFIDDLFNTDSSNFQTNLIKMTITLNQLSHLLLEYSMYENCEELEIKNMLRCMFFRHNIHHHVDVPVTKPNGANGSIDVLITKEKIYIAIETTLNEESSYEGLVKIKSDYMTVLDTEPYAITQNNYLFLGIHLAYKNDVSLSANYTNHLKGDPSFEADFELKCEFSKTTGKKSITARASYKNPHDQKTYVLAERWADVSVSKIDWSKMNTNADDV